MLHVNGNRKIQKFVGKGSTEELDIPVIYKIKGAKKYSERLDHLIHSSETATLGPFIRGKIRRVLHANFPYKRHISSKIRRGVAKTSLIR